MAHSVDVLHLIKCGEDVAEKKLRAPEFPLALRL